jgi:hypothetical protein
VQGEVRHRLERVPGGLAHSGRTISKSDLFCSGCKTDALCHVPWQALNDDYKQMIDGMLEYQGRPASSLSAG